MRYLQKIDNSAIFEIQGYCSEHTRVAKLKKFACRSLPGTGVRSGIRVIFAFLPAKSKVVFLEIYHKNEQENEDTSRVEGYLE